MDSLFCVVVVQAEGFGGDGRGSQVHPRLGGGLPLQVVGRHPLGRLKVGGGMGREI